MKHADFNDLVTMEPAVQPIIGSEEPTQEEIDALDDITSEVVKFIYGDNNASVLGSIANTPELYQGVGFAAFQILLSIKQQFELEGTKVPPATLFGEGGAIHTTVDELFQVAQAAGVEGSDDEAQYSASVMEVMRLAGEYIETTGDDDSISEAQELLIDIEETGQGGMIVETSEDEESLRSTIQRSLDAQNQALQPEQVEEGAPQQQQQPAVPGSLLNG